MAWSFSTETSADGEAGARVACGSIHSSLRLRSSCVVRMPEGTRRAARQVAALLRRGRAVKVEGDEEDWTKKRRWTRSAAMLPWRLATGLQRVSKAKWLQGFAASRVVLMN
ncbi:hypothetical protein TRIUR3_34724 [Triticum urartu]|uniref:Uncharacterized protein n=1 Tax=Triticum urartu TaxID=4572 RepID=M7ZSC1_TRIUA|nr:hypothetical protein TRIUR3_34724 [Triticum urartu]